MEESGNKNDQKSQKVKKKDSSSVLATVKEEVSGSSAPLRRVLTLAGFLMKQTVILAKKLIVSKVTKLKIMRNLAL